eukprot:Gb_24157 [translate_table: standard]
MHGSCLELLGMLVMVCTTRRPGRLQGDVTGVFLSHWKTWRLHGDVTGVPEKPWTLYWPVEQSYNLTAVGKESLGDSCLVGNSDTAVAMADYRQNGQGIRSGVGENQSTHGESDRANRRSAAAEQSAQVLKVTVTCVKGVNNVNEPSDVLKDGHMDVFNSKDKTLYHSM